MAARTLPVDSSAGSLIGRPSFAVVSSVLSPGAVLAELQGAYGLDGSARCELLQRGLNDTYLVRVGGERLVARVYRAGYRSAPEITWELELLGHLADRGVSVSVPLPDRDGRLLRSVPAAEGVRQLAVFSYAAGLPLGWESEHDGAVAGRLAAAIHSAADDFTSVHPRRALDLDELLERPLRAVEPFLAHRRTDFRELVEMAHRLGDRIASAAEAGLDWGPVHGDLNVKNMHATTGGQPTIFDFDFCGPGWRAYDLAAGPYYAVYDGNALVWEAFLRGYSDERTLPAPDGRAIPLLHAAGRIWSVGLKAIRAAETGTSRVGDRRFDALLTFLRKLPTDGEQVPVCVRRVPARRDAPQPNRERRCPRRPPLEVVSSVLSPGAVLAELQGAYGLDGSARCELLQRGLNDTYLVRVGGERLVARVYRAGYRSAPEIIWELELLGHLADSGVSVSVPLPACDGCLLRPLPAPEGTRQLVLFSYAPGSPLAWESEPDCALVGRLAARIHAAADDFMSDKPRRALDLDELLERPLRAIERFLAHRPDEFRQLVGITRRLGDRIAEAAAAGLDWGPVHGDLNVKNMHAIAGGQPTIFDFDFCGPGWRTYDLVAAWRIGGRDERSTPWRSFLGGYETVKTLARRDLSAVGLFDAAGRIWSFGLRATRTREAGTARLGDWYVDRVLASLRRHQAEHER